MATPRKHWFRVADGVLNKPWTNNELAAMVRLMAYLNTRWARSGLEPDEACCADIPTVAVMQITGRGRADVARSSLERLAVLAEIFVEIKPEVCSIKWPNYAEFQEYRSRDCPGIALGLPRPHPYPQTHRKREEKKEPAAVAASLFSPGDNSKPKPEKRARRAKRIATTFPDPFPPDMRERLHRWGAERSLLPVHVDYAIDFIRDWSGSNDKLKKDWEAAIRNGMRAGWALPKPGGPTGETPEQRYSRMAREMEEEDAET